ncbi:hypothetical protein BS50DRAFT_578125 [Corynespora cassiicola Philippines]|uniref:BZIP domain-containing protein n=1 Tax=Corynespora cassiicola Philippines TaxID=1448308 RepID=A0A2T2NA87_CORCC|nr:hypothetical protein BS50DRAFT_578125 [Corynespora cassiicola Philippines]
MSESKATKAQNLARIRDNQRRSRARRKEYLQELEAKLRSCEQMGIEASAEIQSAARKVLEENKRLRALLYERGVPEAEIIAVMGGERAIDHVSAASSLTSMLDRRIPCGNMSCTSSPPTSHVSTATTPQHGSTTTPITIPVQRPAALGSNDSPSPHSIVSSLGSTPPAFSSTQYYPGITPAPNIKTEDMQNYNNYQYNQSINTWSMPQDINYPQDSIAYYNTSSCIDAANIIRTMRADAGPELEADLGCQAPVQNCYVDNGVVFNLVDKYSNTNTRYGI